MADLLQCPFCGEPAFADYDTYGMQWRVVCECDWCGVEGPVEDNQADAVAAWNRRASPPVPARTRWRVSPWRDPQVVERRHVRRTARPW